MRIASDGFIDVRDGRRVRTPGACDRGVAPVPEGEALAYLLSHSLPGRRVVVRPMSLTERARIRLAMWSSSVAERMAHIDRIWRSMTEPAPPPSSFDRPVPIQVIECEGWAYPLYADGASTRVIPPGGVPAGEVALDASLRFGRVSA